jgi:hypothetical protein
VVELATFANVVVELPNVLAGLTTFTTPMAIKESHVKQVLVV